MKLYYVYDIRVILTAAVAENQMWKSPNVAQSNCISNAGDCEFQRIRPIASFSFDCVVVVFVGAILRRGDCLRREERNEWVKWSYYSESYDR